jgi:hypothetical protein
MTVKKRFCKELHQTNDTLARAAGKTYWSSVGYEVKDNPDQYGADLIVNTGQEEFYSEVEIKRVWSGPNFAYDTLQIPGRKKKFTELDKPCVFVVFNNEQTHAFACHSDVLKESPLVEVPNKYVYSGEMFYQVPITKLQYVTMPC